MELQDIRDIVQNARPKALYPFIGREAAAEKLNADGPAKPLMDEIAAEAERFQSEPIPVMTYSVMRLFAEIGDREQSESVYFRRRARLAAFALTYLQTGDKRYLNPLQDIIWDICNEYTWCLPAHFPAEHDDLKPARAVDLFAAETAHALAEISYLLRDRLEAAITERVREEIETRVFSSVFNNPNGLWWEKVEHNWASVCGGAIGMAALLLVEDRDRLSVIIERTIRTMNCFLSGYGEDGGCAEGIGYWEYGFGYYAYFAEMLYAFTNGEIDLLKGEKLGRIAAFPDAVHLSEGSFANYSDSPERTTLHPGLLSRLSQKKGRRLSFPCRVPGFHADSCYRWAHLSRSLLWTDEACFGGAPSEGMQLLPDLAWIIDRRTLAGSTAAFSSKGGHNAEPHNHNDLGHFIVHAGGVNLLCDLGHGLYTKDYFGAGRYEILNNASGGHSVPILNGVQQSAGKQYAAKVMEAAEKENGALFRLDLTNAYPRDAKLKQFIRSFEWSCDRKNDECRFVLHDTVSFLEEGTMAERFVSRIRPVYADGEVVWETPEARLRLPVDYDRLEMNIIYHPYVGHAAEPVDVYITELQTREPTRQADFVFDFRLEMKRRC